MADGSRRSFRGRGGTTTGRVAAISCVPEGCHIRRTHPLELDGIAQSFCPNFEFREARRSGIPLGSAAARRRFPVVILPLFPRITTGDHLSTLRVEDGNPQAGTRPTLGWALRRPTAAAPADRIDCSWRTAPNSLAAASSDPSKLAATGSVCLAKRRTYCPTIDSRSEASSRYAGSSN